MIDLAIIPARRGSVGVPGKNILPLGGHALIAWTIRAALRSGVFANVVVSTDGEDIAQVARSYGARVPFLRPDKLATSTATSFDVAKHALGYFDNVATFAFLQPTSPFRASRHLVESSECWFRSEASALLSVKREKPVSWMFQLDRQKKLSQVLSDQKVATRRQDEDGLVTPNGALYFCKTNHFIEQKSFFCEDTIGFVMNSIDSTDIDTFEDVEKARAYLQAGLVKWE